MLQCSPWGLSPALGWGQLKNWEGPCLAQSHTLCLSWSRAQSGPQWAFAEWMACTLWSLVLCPGGRPTVVGTRPPQHNAHLDALKGWREIRTIRKEGSIPPGSVWELLVEEVEFEQFLKWVEAPFGDRRKGRQVSQERVHEGEEAGANPGHTRSTSNGTPVGLVCILAEQGASQVKKKGLSCFSLGWQDQACPTCASLA